MRTNYFSAALLSVAIMTTLFVERAQGATVPAGDPAIVYEGRTANNSSGGVRMGFPGVTTHLRFRGNALSLFAEASSDTVYFDVSVDGAAPTLLRLRKGEGQYPLFNAATSDEHTLELVRRTESWQGVCELKRFDLGEKGALLPAPALPLRKLLFIGDSVTCGSMTAWEPTHAHGDPLSSNARTSYGMMLAKKFSAQCHLVSCGGRGLVRDWQGIRDLRAAPQFYELALPDVLSSPWDHAHFVPDAIGVQLGTNDFSSGIPDEIEFVTTYVEFLQKVRRDAPGAFIFLMESPILKDDEKGPRRAVLHAYLERIIRQVGSHQVTLAPLKHEAGVPNDGHPTLQEHESMAAELEPLLRQRLGW